MIFRLPRPQFLSFVRLLAAGRPARDVDIVRKTLGQHGIARSAPAPRTAAATPNRAEPADPGGATGIDKSVLTIAAPRRYRNRDHLRLVAQQPCLICGRKQSDPHHLRHMQPAALGRKASEEFAVPLCRTHRRAAHRTGDERAWWKASSIDPIKAAR